MIVSTGGFLQPSDHLHGPLDPHLEFLLQKGSRYSLYYFILYVTMKIKFDPSINRGTPANQCIWTKVAFFQSAHYPRLVVVMLLTWILHHTTCSKATHAPVLLCCFQFGKQSDLFLSRHRGMSIVKYKMQAEAKSGISGEEYAHIRTFYEIWSVRKHLLQKLCNST